MGNAWWWGERTLHLWAQMRCASSINISPPHLELTPPLPPCAPGSLLRFLDDPVTLAALSLPPAALNRRQLANDLYKPRMHALYCTLAPGVGLDFELWVRKTPVTLSQIRDEVRAAGRAGVAELQGGRGRA